MQIAPARENVAYSLIIGRRGGESPVFLAIAQLAEDCLSSLRMKPGNLRGQVRCSRRSDSPRRRERQWNSVALPEARLPGQWHGRLAEFLDSRVRKNAGSLKHSPFCERGYTQPD